MEATIFRKLLTDLYEIYNPDKLVDIERIITQNNGREFDAIKTIYLKYNFKQSPSYDPKLGTDKQVKSLIEKYNSGNMKLEEEKVEEPIVLVEEKNEEPVLNKMPFDISLKFNFDADSLIIPDLQNFFYGSINQRMILKTKDGGLIGVEIIDVLDDYLSEKPTREIVLEKK